MACCTIARVPPAVPQCSGQHLCWAALQQQTSPYISTACMCGLTEKGADWDEPQADSGMAVNPSVQETYVEQLDI